MDRIMKTGIIAAGTVAAAGLAFGMSPVTTRAAELDTEAGDAVVQDSVEMTVPETTEEAKQAVETAETEMERADAAVNEAQMKVDEAHASIEDASKTVETARTEADEAFEDAKAEAAEADAAAQTDVEDASRIVDEMEGKVQQAGEDVISAREALEEAENSVREAEAESPSEGDIIEKEFELAAAESGLTEAESAVGKAESERNAAAECADEKDAAKSAAEEVVREARIEKETTDMAVAEAGEAADQAEKELQQAEALKNGTLDIKDTDQYREEQEAKEVKDKATENAEIAAENMDRASEALANAEAAVNTAEKELDSAVGALNETDKELTNAEKAREAAAVVREEAQNRYDHASAEAADASATVAEAENVTADAEATLKMAEEAKDAADDALEAARAAVDAVRQDAEAAVNAKIADAENETAEKQAATEEAQESLDVAMEKYKQGTLGLIEWMMEKDGLTEEQQYDLRRAREVLLKASEEDFSNWYGGDNTGLPEERKGKVVVIGDEKDATNLDNLQKSIEVMKKINQLRANDDNYTGDLRRNDSLTNFYFMATAEAGAMRGAGLRRHSSLTTSCENLSFNLSDPTAGWYNMEKGAFDMIKNKLGISEITSMKDVAKIEEEADNLGVDVGHYTNLFWAVDQVMGIGCTQYRGTYCYNASKASNYKSDRYSMGMHLYTVGEFEQLVAEYNQNVNKSTCEEAFNKAAAECSKAERRLQELLNNKDLMVETAIQGAKAEFAAKESEAEQAGQTFADAKEGLVRAEKALEEAEARKASAIQELKNAQELLNRAEEESTTADTAFAFAEKARDDASRVLADAETALTEALAFKSDAEVLLEKKEALLADAYAALEKAVNAHSAAEKKLADLTSDETINALREQKYQADIILQAALDQHAVKDEALNQAEAIYAQAEADASAAKSALREAENRVTEATLERESKKEAVSRLFEELTNLREQYEPLLRAVEARDAAKENLGYAESIFESAESDLARAQDDFYRAEHTKAAAADKLHRATGLSVEEALKADIEDPDFIHLNDYVAAVKAAEAELSRAIASMEAANEELEARKTDSEKAQETYIAAVARLVIVQNCEEITSQDPDPKVESDPIVEEAEATEVSLPEFSETDIKPAEPAENGSHDVDRTGGEPALQESLANGYESLLAKAEPGGYVHTAGPVATGDKSNVMVLLAELLASVSLLGVVFKLRKGAEEKK